MLASASLTRVINVLLLCMRRTHNYIQIIRSCTPNTRNFTIAASIHHSARNPSARSHNQRLHTCLPRPSKIKKLSYPNRPYMSHYHRELHIQGSVIGSVQTLGMNFCLKSRKDRFSPPSLQSLRFHELRAVARRRLCILTSHEVYFLLL